MKVSWGYLHLVPGVISILKGSMSRLWAQITFKLPLHVFYVKIVLDELYFAA